MKKNHYKSLITLLVVIFITVLSCSRDDGEDEQVPNIPNIPNTTTPTNDTNPTDNSNNTNSTINNPSLYNLYQAQSFMHWLNPTDTCSVGYDINPYKELRSKECGIESERHECKRCRHHSFGVESEIIHGTYFVPKHYMLDKIPYKPNTYIYDICQSHVQEMKNEAKGRVPIPSGASLYVTVSSGYFITRGSGVMTHYRVPESSQIICYYLHEVKIPLYFEKENCQICGSIDETTYKLCKHPSHGAEEKVLKSSLDLSKQDVERLEGKVLGCKTCDHIKFDILNMDEDNDTQLVNRITCLLNNLDSSDTNNEDKQGIITELKRLTVYSELINKTHPDLYAKVKEHI